DGLTGDRDRVHGEHEQGPDVVADLMGDRKSTRLNSSHVSISYAVFCLKKKKHTPVDIVNLELHNIVLDTCVWSSLRPFFIMSRADESSKNFMPYIRTDVLITG